jgi:sugar phosphate isomerase/epimerase
MDTVTMNRRSMLRTVSFSALAVAAVPGVVPGLLFASEGRRIERIGVQLYTVRDLLAADPPGTLDAVAGMGYVEVETAGYAGLTPQAFAVTLKNAGLDAPSAHVPLTDIESAPERLLEAAAIVGHRYLVVPWLDPALRVSTDSYAQVAEVLNGFGEACAGQGIQLAYHNHDFEFAPFDDVVPYDLLLERCDPNLVKFELDLFWAAKAGADAAAYFRAWPGRFPLCHVKDMTAAGEMVAVGDGRIDFAALFDAGATGGLKHYFVEHDNPEEPLASIRRSFESVQAIRF